MLELELETSIRLSMRAALNMTVLVHELEMRLTMSMSCVQCGEAVSVDIAASFLTKTSALQSFVDQTPDWIASSAMTTFQSSWTFSQAGQCDGIMYY